uniref:Peptidase n=1 Tax=viral metagenome TaxID=1070528 RepID=A0A6M3LL07_9ZZZZ
MIQKPIYFKLEELVPQSLFAAHKGDQDRLWWCFDPRVLWTADKLRMLYGKMICNTWLWGGIHFERGLRLLATKTGAVLSQHKFGRALDLVPVDTTAEAIRQDILAHPGHDEFKFIKCLEINIPWLHFDVRNWIGPILTFNK